MKNIFFHLELETQIDSFDNDANIDMNNFEDIEEDNPVILLNNIMENGSEETKNYLTELIQSLKSVENIKVGFIFLK